MDEHLETNCLRNVDVASVTGKLLELIKFHWKNLSCDVFPRYDFLCCFRLKKQRERILFTPTMIDEHWTKKYWIWTATYFRVTPQPWLFSFGGMKSECELRIWMKHVRLQRVPTYFCIWSACLLIERYGKRYHELKHELSVYSCGIVFAGIFRRYNCWVPPLPRHNIALSNFRSIYARCTEPPSKMSIVCCLSFDTSFICPVGDDFLMHAKYTLLLCECQKI